MSTLNEYTYDELISAEFDKEHCTRAEFKAEVTESMMKEFLDICGDVNPMHVDREFAKGNGFKDRIVYGMLTSTFYSTLAVVYLPGKYCLLQGVDSEFHNPVFIGDQLTISGYVKEKNDSVRQVIVKADIKNQDGKKVSKATIKLGCLR